MRIVLRNSETSLYLQNLGSWVKSANEALNFMNSIRALQFCVFHKLNAEVVPVLEAGEVDQSRAGAVEMTRNIDVNLIPQLRTRCERW